MKKYLLGLLAVPIMSPLLSIASADSVDGFTSDSEICKFDYGYSQSQLGLASMGYQCSLEDPYYLCISTDNVPYNAYSSYYSLGSSPISISSDNYCFAGTFEYSSDGDLHFCSGFDQYDTCVYFDDFTFVAYGSNSPISYSSPSGGSSDSVLPELSVPSSFTSGLSSLVNNFGSTISEWIPAVILLTLGITCIYALFRVVRNYARRSFKG